MSWHPTLSKGDAMSGDPRRDGQRRRAELTVQTERRAQLAEQYGKPETIAAADALALARTALVHVDPTATADDIWASIYRDDKAAEAWLQSNLTHHGHPALARVLLPDGRVIGILDLRPALARYAEGETP